MSHRPTSLQEQINDQLQDAIPAVDICRKLRIMQESMTPFVSWQKIHTKSISKEVQMITIVGISGSIRKHSFNSGLLRAPAEAVPDGCSLKIGSIIDIPLYNADIE